MNGHHRRSISQAISSPTEHLAYLVLGSSYGCLRTRVTNGMRSARRVGNQTPFLAWALGPFPSLPNLRSFVRDMRATTRRNADTDSPDAEREFRAFSNQLCARVDAVIPEQQRAQAKRMLRARLHSILKLKYDMETGRDTFRIREVCASELARIRA